MKAEDKTEVEVKAETGMRGDGTSSASTPEPASTASRYVERVRADRGERLTGHRPLLEHLDIELTERCNNDCIHCCINLPADDSAALEREMSSDRVKGILTEAADLGCLSVRFTGGEPLLREDFEELYLFARRLGMKVTLFTNARLITSRLADLFARIPPLVPVEVSVYGMKPESYEAVSRVPGSYPGFRHGLDLLLDRRIPFIVKGALLPPNIEELEEFETWAATLPAMEGPPSCSMFFELRGRRDSPAGNRRIASLRVSPEAGVAFLNRHPERYLPDMHQFCARFIGPTGDSLFTCGAGHGPCVDAFGKAQACLPLRHPDTVFDLGNGTLEEALTGFFPRLREMKAANPDYLAHCARCFLKGLCEQCPARSWTEHGSLDTPVEYLCQVAHAQARDLGLLREGERAWEVEDWKRRTRTMTNAQSPMPNDQSATVNDQCSMTNNDDGQATKRKPRAYDLEQRTSRFGRDVIRFAGHIPKSTVTVPLIPQLVRAATSVGANYCEADEAASRKDFRHKLSICRKEAHEVEHWLRMVVEAVPELRNEARPLAQEARELSLIFNASIRTASSKGDK